MKSRIVITGIGLTSPNANNLKEFREALLHGKSGIKSKDVRYVGKCPSGDCQFDEAKYQTLKMRARGTRAGSIAIYAANEAIKDANIDLATSEKDRIGIYLGVTEHGTVETDREIHEMLDNKYPDATYWSPSHNPRTVANAPAGEVALNLKITGPHYTIGAACAAGNLGPITASQMLELNQVDLALAGGISECSQSFVLFAAFNAQTALASHANPEEASRPLDRDRNGIVISEGGCIFTLERLDDALKRKANIYAEIVGYHVNTDATDFVLPNAQRQFECMTKALAMAGIKPEDIDIINMHATGTSSGDAIECDAIRKLFGHSNNTYLNATKGFIGHTMGAAGALELAGNIPSFTDGLIHPCKNLHNLDPKCELKNIVTTTKPKEKITYILSNSFGMLGINSTLIIKKYEE